MPCWPLAQTYGASKPSQLSPASPARRRSCSIRRGRSLARRRQARSQPDSKCMIASSRAAMVLISSRLPAKEFFVESQRRGFQAGAIVSPEEAFEDEHATSRGFQVAVHHDLRLRTLYTELGLDDRFFLPPDGPRVFDEIADRVDELLAEPEDMRARLRAGCATALRDSEASLVQMTYLVR